MNAMNCVPPLWLMTPVTGGVLDCTRTETSGALVHGGYGAGI